MLTDKEKAYVQCSIDFAEHLFDRIEKRCEPEAVELISKLKQVGKLTSYALSKTLSVVVWHCREVKGGKNLEDLFEKWLFLAEIDIITGHQIMKEGFEGHSFDEMNASTMKKMNELDESYSNMSDKELSDQCEKYTALVSQYIDRYES